MGTEWWNLSRKWVEMEQRKIMVKYWGLFYASQIHFLVHISSLFGLIWIFLPPFSTTVSMRPFFGLFRPIFVLAGNGFFTFHPDFREF